MGSDAGQKVVETGTVITHYYKGLENRVGGPLLAIPRIVKQWPGHICAVIKWTSAPHQYLIS